MLLLAGAELLLYYSSIYLDFSYTLLVREKANFAGSIEISIIMLSKAEVLYLQGQRQVSKSYERKLKCIIQKKLEILRNEYP